MTALCLCGSGKIKQECHGNDIDGHTLRKIIKYNFSSVGHGKIFLEQPFVPQKFDSKLYECQVRFLRAITPAGEILYPLIITYEDKSLRPLTIDGLAFRQNDNDIDQLISCMVTPLSFCTIVIEKLNTVPCENGIYRAKCYVKADGDPFSSIFALETENDSIALYHHTNEESRKAIILTGKMMGSKWNFQGTKEIEHFNYIYLTSLSTIKGDIDLIEIGMEAAGSGISIITDSEIMKELKVYRDNPINRHATLKVWLNIDMLSPNPIILHRPESFVRTGPHGGFSWLEVIPRNGETRQVSNHRISN
jgi:hypothetical protein